MLTIFRKKILNDKKLVYALCVLYGISKMKAITICKNLSISLNAKVGDLTNSKLTQLVTYIKTNCLIEDFLYKSKYDYVERYKQNTSVKGFRHRNNLPVRGQRTHTNARTRKRVKI